MKDLKTLPGVDKLLNLNQVKGFIEKYGRDLTKHSLRKVLSDFRVRIRNGDIGPSLDQILNQAQKEIVALTEGNLKSLINATGIIIHTNLGRSPFGKVLVKDVSEILSGYSNLEYSLEKGIRSDRNCHAAELIKYITGAEDVLVVNNNAAAVMLILSTFAKNREVIISRGELIEIGGSFRMPDIMTASGCKMIEIGTTNKTRISDYSSAINVNTGLLFKAHRSNFKIRGFTEEVDLEDLVKLGKKYKIPVVFDLGSGLLKEMNISALRQERSVRQSLLSGVDLVCFSGDKLLGGPQAGIITGSVKMIGRLKKEPMTRALRACKITLAFLENACRYYLNDNDIYEKNMIFRILRRSKDELKGNAEILQKELANYNIPAKVIKTQGQVGGGTMPDFPIDSFAVRLNVRFISGIQRSAFAENIFGELLKSDKPVVGVIKQGKIHFDVLTLFGDDIYFVAKAIHKAYLKFFL